MLPHLNHVAYNNYHPHCYFRYLVIWTMVSDSKGNIRTAVEASAQETYIRNLGIYPTNL